MVWLGYLMVKNVDDIFSHFNTHQHVTDRGERFKSYRVDKHTHTNEHTLLKTIPPSLCGR